MKKMLLILCFILLTNIYVTAADTPKVDAASAILIDFETGRVLWEKNARDPMAMASLTKIMTAVIALENGNMGDTVTVSHTAAAAPKVKMYLTAGEKISLQTLMFALMLQSSNDAAVAIAEHVGGSVDEFCAMMTAKAREIGANDTVFRTPNGLDKDDHHSTAYDMALITRYALQNEKFVRLINTRSITAQSNLRTYSIVNRNRLLNEFDGAYGVKTGFTNKAGYCFAGSAERGGMKLISVVLASGWGAKGSEQKWIDTKRVLGYGFGEFKYEEVIDETVNMGRIAVGRSRLDSLPLKYAEGLTIPLSYDEKAAMRVEIELPESVKAPVSEGDVVGLAKIIVNDEVYAEINILAVGSAERHDFKTSLEKVLGAFLGLASVDEIKVILPEFY
jgi:D-alanyl-D-alanine carboxypeptidase (penicillin-binding protein 5/6)